MNIKYIFSTFIVTLLFVPLCSFIKTPLDNFRPGYYENASGRVEGFIDFQFNSYKKFDFKKELNGKKETITADQCTSFRIDGSSTFKVIENITIKVGFGSESPSKAFAEVVNEGRINLYKVYTQISTPDPRPNSFMEFTSIVENYPLEKNNNKQYTLAHPINKRKFEKAMIALVQDRSDIVELIKNDIYNFKNIEGLVYDYNSKD